MVHEAKKNQLGLIASLPASRFLPPLNSFFLNVNLFVLQLKTV
jgi:hypothetical protein